MLFVSLIRWWYGQGWLGQVMVAKARFIRTADYFTFEQTLRSLFQPFRQIDAERVDKGPMVVILRALFDQLFSRLFGAVIRLGLLLFGIVALIVQALIGILSVIVWPFVLPVPLLSFFPVFTGWVPWL